MSEKGKRDSGVGQRIFTVLLRLLPRDFREHFGREMRAVFTDQESDARAEGKAAQARLWASTYGGLIATAVREHLDIVERDVRFSFRVIRKDRAFLISSVATLGLAMGACTAAFLAAHAILLRPLPFSSGDRLVQLSQRQAGVDSQIFSVQEINDLRQQSTAFDSVFEYHEMTFTLLGGREPQRVDTGVVSANFFRSLGISPLYGRDFFDDDEKHDAAPVLILSYQFWERSFGRDPDIIGRKFSMNDREHIVVGVLPPLPQFPEVVDVYMPTSACPTRSNPRTIENREHPMVQVFGTLKSSVTLAQAQSDLHQIAGRQRSAFPAVYKDAGHDLALSLESDDLRRDVRPILIVLAAAAALLLLLACANTAGLMLSRVLARARDIGIRSALGASTTRLVRAYITEGLVVAFLGGTVGLLLALWSIGLLVRLTSRFTTLSTQLHMGAEVLGFWFVTTVAVGLFLGLAPAIGIRTSSLWGMPLAKPASIRRSNATHRVALVSTQLALSVVLLVGSGLTLRNVMRLQHVDGGFQSRGVLTARVYVLNKSWRSFFETLMQRTRALPGVESAAVASSVPLNWRGAMATAGPLLVKGDESHNQRSSYFRIASRDYFQAIGARVVEGRGFLVSDNHEAPLVAVVNQHLARHYWGEASPLGKQVFFYRDGNGRELWGKVVGVVSDFKYAGLDKEPLDEVFASWEQTGGNTMTLVVRTSGPLESLARSLGWIVHDLDQDAVIADVKPMDKVRSDSLASPRLTATFLTIFAVIALAITASGISGMMALMVTDRRQEIGIRLALGATPGAVMRAMLAKVAPAMCIGLGAGLAAAWWLSQSMEQIAIAAPARDALTFATSSLVLAGTAALFAVAPLTSISRLDPGSPLRAE